MNRSSISPAIPIPSLLQMADRFSNLLLVRSMSKHCGVPGLRLGYCYSENLYVLNRMRQFIPTWNVNTLGAIFPVSAAIDRRRLSRSAKTLDRRCSLALRRTCETISGIDVYPTGANFVLFKIKGGMTAARTARTSAERTWHVRARLLEQDRHGQFSYPRGLARPRKRCQAGEGAPDIDPMKRPAVLVVTRRTVRKNKYIDYVGEVSSCAPDPAGDSAGDGARGRRRAPRAFPTTWRTCGAFCWSKARTSSQNTTRPGRKTTSILRKLIRSKDEIEIRLIRHALRKKAADSWDLPRVATAQRRLRRHAVRRCAKGKEVSPEAYQFRALRQLSASDFHRSRKPAAKDGTAGPRCA